MTYEDRARELVESRDDDDLGDPHGHCGCEQCMRALDERHVARIAAALRSVERETVEEREHLRALLADCVRAMRKWAADEDGVHPEAWEAFCNALREAPLACVCSTWGREDVLSGDHAHNCPMASTLLPDDTEDDHG